jgi:hypothetical protein
MFFYRAGMLPGIAGAASAKSGNQKIQFAAAAAVL